MEAGSFVCLLLLQGQGSKGERAAGRGWFGPRWARPAGMGLDGCGQWRQQQHIISHYFLSFFTRVTWECHDHPIRGRDKCFGVAAAPAARAHTCVAVETSRRDCRARQLGTCLALSWEGGGRTTAAAARSQR